MGEVLGKELVYPSHPSRLSAGVRLGRAQEFPLEVAHQTLGRRPKQPGNLGRLVSLLGLEGSGCPALPTATQQEAQTNHHFHLHPPRHQNQKWSSLQR